MTLLASRLGIVAACTTAAVVLAFPVSASADGASFSETRIDEAPQPDAIPGLGSATADATADLVTGSVSATTDVFERAPVGLSGSQIGTSTSVASGRLVQYLDVPVPGTYRVAVTISGLENATASAAALGIPGFGAATSNVSAVALASFCVPDAAGGCNPVPGGGSGSTSAAVACSAGCPPTSSAPLSLDINAPLAGKIYLESGLSAVSYAQGLGSARAAGAGTVSSASATRTGEANQPTGGQPGGTRVLVDTVTVDSRGTAVTSLTALEAGRPYILEAQGIYGYSSGGETADAECATWPGDATYRPDRLPDDQLDLTVDGSGVTWTPAAGSANAEVAGCSDTHTYELSVTGAGTPVSFDINDAGKVDNLGALTVKIYLLP